MTPLPSYLYGLAADHDNIAGIQIFQNITATGSPRKFYPPVGYSNYRPGQRQVLTDSLIKIVGKPSAFWIVSITNRFELEYLPDTYCNGGVSGPVTVQTRIGRQGYKIFNAIMTIPDPADWDRIYKLTRNYRIDFTAMRFLEDVEE